MMLTQLARVLRAAGLTVIEEPGWTTRGHGPMVDVRGVTCHHTANGGAAGLEPSRAVIRDGRPDLEGPLAHLLLRKDGVYRVIAAGLCYHAGRSRDAAFTNPHRIGIEAEAKGLPGAAGDWPAVQMRAYARGCAALVDHFDLTVADVLGHKETAAPAGRKSDPSFDMDDFRRDVALANLNTPLEKEDRMQPSDWPDHKLTAADARALGDPGRVGEPVGWSSLIRHPPAVQQLRREQAAGFAALTATIGLLAGPRGATLTQAQITAAAEAGARAALAELGDALADGSA